MYNFVYSETTSYYENVPGLLRGIFYTYSVVSVKLSQEFAFRRVHTIHNPSIKVYSCQFM